MRQRCATSRSPSSTSPPPGGRGVDAGLACRPVPEEVLEMAGRRRPQDHRRCDQGRRGYAAGGDRRRSTANCSVGGARTDARRPVQRGSDGGGRLPRANGHASPLARLGQHRVGPSRPLPRRGDPRRNSVIAAIGAAAGAGGHRRLAGIGVGDGDRVRRSLLARCGIGGLAHLERRGHVQHSEHGTVGLRAAAEKILAERLAGWQERYPDVTVHRRRRV